MSTRAFDRMFTPRSVVLVGASDRPKSVGAVTLANLQSGGYGGTLYAVNPNHDRIAGLRAFPDVTKLPQAPDLAVIETPPDQVAGVIRQLGTVGTHAAVIITAGFGELGEQGKRMQRDIVAAAAEGSVRVVGPNCLGIMVPGIGLNASFAHLSPASGGIAFVSQSGALITAVLDWAKPRRIGFSNIVSLGDMADVDFGDMLEYLAEDPATSAILLYVEGLIEASAFMAAAREAAKAKPIVAIKVGRHPAAAKAARSHTGALAGSDAVYEAAFRRAGMLRVASLPEMFDAVETLALTTPQGGERLTILTNGGGPGVLATDALIGLGGTLAQPAPSTIERLNAMLPPTWSHGNPVDMIGDAHAKEYGETLDVLLSDPLTDAVLVLNCPTALTDPAEAAQAVIACVQGARQRGGTSNVYTSWLGEATAAPSRALFEAAGIPTYNTPDDAIEGFMHRVRFAQNQGLLAESMMPGGAYQRDAAAATAAVQRALIEGRRWLDYDHVEAICAAYGIPTAPNRSSAADARAAAAAAAQLGGPVALKIRSPQITHKSDIGGVALNLRGAEAVRAAADAMLQRVSAARPDAKIEGFFVQEMVQRPGAIELIAGLSVDAVFGPVVLFGHGGTAVETIADTSIELAPLNAALARRLIARTRVARLLAGYRGQPPADLDAIAEVLVRLGDLIVAHPQIAELDINPLLADAQGVIALDVRISVDSAMHTPSSVRFTADRVATVA
ncbi:MAG TPA: acetate--CoA ligase family protein [Candidatus Acidoferrales bacterium]|nr:acetate--CoA ligase family protein [Candidatus Acidoferrales bacterium]